MSPRIARVVGYRLELPFLEGDYRISGGRIEQGLDTTIVALHADDGTVGWGEMAPLGRTYAPSFAAGARAALGELAPVVLGLDAHEPNGVAIALDGALRGHPYAKSPVDMAAWDLAARSLGLPLSSLLGGRFGSLVDLYRALPIGEPAATVELARAYVGSGYRRLQVKVGDDPVADAERVLAVRAAVGDAVTLFADANGGWSLRDARIFLQRVGGDALILEQPCATIEECAELRPSCARPIVLDESIDSLAALLRARELGLADGITIKIARVGGITPARLIRDVAAALRIHVTIEDTGGADIDTAAIVHLAISTPEPIRVHCYPFHELTGVSNADGMPRAHDGRLSCPAGPGLGVATRLDVLGKPFFELGAP